MMNAVLWSFLLMMTTTTTLTNNDYRTRTTTTRPRPPQMFAEAAAAAMSTGASLPGSSSSSHARYFMGFDLGTSGARISVIEKTLFEPTKPKLLYKELHSDSVSYRGSYDDPTCWVTAVDSLLQGTPLGLKAGTHSICISGTSASCLLVDAQTGKPTRGTRAKMYDYDVVMNNMLHSPPPCSSSSASEGAGAAAAAVLQVRQWMEEHVPVHHVARSNTSALAKLLHYHACQSISSCGSGEKEVLAHQSEYVATTLFLSQKYKCGAGPHVNKRQYVSDWHNALKLGYDVKRLEYPTWLLQLLEHVGIPCCDDVLPRVVEPGEPIGTVSKEAREKYGFSNETMIVGGTTDSNASFLAASSSLSDPYGIAVTSLGSTLAIKMLSRTFVEDCSRGVYSHRFPSSLMSGFFLGRRRQQERDDESQLWLVGGASNVGCAVLRQENFSNEELMELSNDMDVTTTDSDYSYYPLTKKGERFPIADGTKEPILEPKPKSRQEYLKAILQGISKVERMGYDTLGNLGASPPFPKVIMTTGGGSQNEKWLQMRQGLFQQNIPPTPVEESGVVKVLKAENTEASFGAAILAASQAV